MKSTGEITFTDSKLANFCDLIIVPLNMFRTSSLLLHFEEVWRFHRKFRVKKHIRKCQKSSPGSHI